MNEEIFKLEELLKESEIPFYFNYREENRPTPFGSVPAELKDEELCITVGPVMENGAEAIVVKPLDKESLVVTETSKMLEENLIATVRYTNWTAKAAFEFIKIRFLRKREEWWPDVYGGKPMREILFRAKRIDNGEWAEGCVFIPRFSGEATCIVEQDAPFHSNFYEVDPETVCQLTGLIDKTGKKIWENDIIEFKDNIYAAKNRGIVVFKKGAYKIEYKGYCRTGYHQIGIKESWKDMQATHEVTYTYEIIGNIFDTPELLEK